MSVGVEVPTEALELGATRGDEGEVSAAGDRDGTSASFGGAELGGGTELEDGGEELAAIAEPEELAYMSARLNWCGR
jgi:hypothetical protein